MSKKENYPEEAFLEPEELQSRVLHLPFPALSAGGDYYSQAMRNHAVPIIEFLVQLHEQKVPRDSGPIAQYTSKRADTALLYNQAWERDLASALIDLGWAVGLKITVTDKLPSKFALQRASNLKRLLFGPDKIMLPTSIQARIDARAEVIQAEVDRLEKLSKTQLDPDNALFMDQMKINIASFLQGVLTNLRVASATTLRLLGADSNLENTATELPIVNLTMTMKFDPKSEEPVFRKSTHSFSRLHHEVILAESI